MKDVRNCEVDALSFDWPRTRIVLELNFLVLVELARDDAAAFKLGEVELGEDVESDRNRVICLISDWRRSLHRSSSQRHLAQTDDRRRNSNRHFVDRRGNCHFDWVQIPDVYQDAVLKETIRVDKI